MTSRTVTKIDVFSAAKLLGVLYAALGLLIGGCITLLALTMSMTASSELRGANALLVGAFMGVGAIIFVPIFYGVIGFVGGAVMAVLYNIVSRWTGGLRVEVEG